MTPHPGLSGCAGRSKLDRFQGEGQHHGVDGLKHLDTRVQRKRALKLGAVASVLILLASTLGQSTFATSGTTERDGESDGDTTNQTYPVSGWDFRIRELANKSSGFDFYGSSSLFTGFLRSSAGNGSQPVMAVVVGNYSVGYAPTSLIKENDGSNERTASVDRVSNVSGTVDGSKLRYSEAFGTDTRMEYQVAWNGLKELVVLDERPSDRGNLTVRGTLFYNTSELAIYTDGERVTDEASTNGIIEFRNSSNETVIVIPKGWARDSSTTSVPGDSGLTRQVPAPRWSEVTYKVDRYGAITYFEVVVPASYLFDANTTYPVEIDPSLGPFIAGYEEYNFEQIEQTSDLTILGGGTLVLRNSSLVWQGPYTLRVDPDATLVLEDTTVDSALSAPFYDVQINGAFQAVNTRFRGRPLGLTWNPPVPSGLTMSGATISGATGDCMMLMGLITPVTVTGSTFSNCGNAGLMLPSAGPFMNTWDVSDNTFNDSLYGLYVKNGDYSAATFDGNTAENNRVVGMVVENAVATFTNCHAYRNARGWAIMSGGSLTLQNCDAEGNAVGAYANALGVFPTAIDLNQVTMTNSSAYDLQCMPGASCQSNGGNWALWVELILNANRTYRHTLTFEVVGSSANPLSNYPVYVLDRYGNPAAPETKTNATGIVNLTVSHKRIQPDNSITYYTPHTIRLGVAPFYDLRTIIESDLDLTLYATGDADNDTLWDADENDPNTWWFRAVDHLVSPSQLNQSNPLFRPTAQRHSDGSFQKAGTFPDVPAGTYRLAFEAWTNESGAPLTLRVENETGTPLLSNTSFALNASASWYLSPEFSFSAEGRPSILLSDAEMRPVGAILVSRLLVVRVADDSAANTTVRPGQVTSAIDPDSDADGASDSLERRGTTFWQEAEAVAKAGFVRQTDADASSGAAAEHPQNDTVVVETAFDGLVQGHSYALWVRARALENPGVTRVQLAIDDGSSADATTPVVSAAYAWCEGPSLAAGSTGSITIRVADYDDPDDGDSVNYVRVDALALVDMATLNEFEMPSNPLQTDTDMDGLRDGPELGGFFTADFVNASEGTLSPYTEIVGDAVRFNADNDWVNLSVTIRYDGDYRFILWPGIWAADVWQQANINATRDLLLAKLSDATNTDLDQEVEFGNAYMGSSSPPMESGLTELEGWYSWVYRNLTTGTYHLKIDVNATAAAVLPAFALYLDRVYVQKRTLVPLDVDFEDDGVYDGLEVERRTFPLNVDSDYDHLDDLEEILAGSDGFETDPLQRDTDGDGLWDAIEVGIWGDNDANTTDPTKADSDSDGLPDGWIDGWSVYDSPGPGGAPISLKDGIRQPWEGEDLDLDGAVKAGGFAVDRSDNATSTGGETDPNNPDSDEDGMLDGWEVWVLDFNTSSYGWGNDPLILNPLLNDSQVDSDVDRFEYEADPDGLTNIQEFLSKTWAFFADTDNDLIRDGDEANITLRTNITNGFVNSKAFAFSGQFSWVYYDSNPYDSIEGTVYWFNDTEENVSEFYPGSLFFGGQLVKTLPDGGAVLYNSGTLTLYVWEAGSEYAYTGSDAYHNGTVHTFLPGGSGGANTERHAQQGYGGQEFLGDVDPLVRDSDGDGIIDGYDGPRFDVVNRWWEDRDVDGRINALDTDSDGDGRPDGTECYGCGEYFDPQYGRTNPYNPDTDHDGVVDGSDTMPLDYDNDGLTGWGAFSDSWGVWGAYGGQEADYCSIPLGKCLAWDNPDTDGDGIPDGVENINGDGFRNANETGALDVDTDDDGLWDGPDFYYGTPTKIEAEATTTRTHGLVNYTGGGASGGKYVEWTGYLESASWTLDLPVAYYRLELAVADDSSPSNATIIGGNVTIEVYLDGVLLNVSFVHVDPVIHLPAVTLATVSAIPIWNSSAHTLAITVVRADEDYRFHLDYLRLSPYHPGEWNASSAALSADSDGDGVKDGAERALVGALIQGNTSAALGTDPALFAGAPFLALSSAASNDSDGDGLADGFTAAVEATRLEAENSTYMFAQPFDQGGVVGLTTQTGPWNATLKFRVTLQVGYYELWGRLNRYGCSGANCTTTAEYRIDLRLNDQLVGRGIVALPDSAWYDRMVGAFAVRSPGTYTIEVLERPSPDHEVRFTADYFDLKGFLVGERTLGSNPSDRDTDRDLLADGAEFMEGTSPLVLDSDGDGLPDSQEAPFRGDFDGSSWDDAVTGRVNNTDAYDADRDEDGWYDGDINESRVVFRTSASRGMYNETGVWIAVDLGGTGVLSGFVYDGPAVLNASNTTAVTFRTRLGGNISRPATTPEGFAVYKNGSSVYIDMPGPLDVRFVAVEASQLPEGATSNLTNPLYMIALREALNWSDMLDQDPDDDGLIGANDPCPWDFDCDEDGIGDGEERANGTDPQNPDSDWDGLWDGPTVGSNVGEWVNGSNPRLADSDLDGLLDGPWNATTGQLGEWNFSTDPSDWDSDADGMPDGWEIKRGFNATNASDGWADLDMDGLSNTMEYSYGKPQGCIVASIVLVNLHSGGAGPEAECREWEDVLGPWQNGTNVSSWDTDGDGLPDGWELRYGLDPKNASDAATDPDGDGLSASAEYQLGRPGAWSESSQGAYWNGSNPSSGDSDGDGITDYDERNGVIYDPDWDGILNWWDLNSDGDCVPDSVEHAGWFISLATTSYWYGQTGTDRSGVDGRLVQSNPYMNDTDGDGKDDCWELSNGADPNGTDTDFDLISDAADAEPTHPESIPPEIRGVGAISVLQCVEVCPDDALGDCSWLACAWELYETFEASRKALYGWQLSIDVHDDAGVQYVEVFIPQINRSEACLYSRTPEIHKDETCVVTFLLPLFSTDGMDFTAQRWVQFFQIAVMDANGNYNFTTKVSGDLAGLQGVVMPFLRLFINDPFQLGMALGAIEGAVLFFVAGAASGGPLVQYLASGGKDGQVGVILRGILDMGVGLATNPFAYVADMVVSTVLSMSRYLNPYDPSLDDFNAFDAAGQGNQWPLLGLLLNATVYSLCKINTPNGCSNLPVPSDWARFTAGHAGAIVAVQLILTVVSVVFLAKALVRTSGAIPRTQTLADHATANGARVNWASEGPKLNDPGHPAIRDGTISLREDGVPLSQAFYEGRAGEIGPGRARTGSRTLGDRELTNDPLPNWMMETDATTGTIRPKPEYQDLAATATELSTRHNPAEIRNALDATRNHPDFWTSGTADVVNPGQLGEAVNLYVNGRRGGISSQKLHDFIVGGGEGRITFRSMEYDPVGWRDGTSSFTVKAYEFSQDSVLVFKVRPDGSLEGGYVFRPGRAGEPTDPTAFRQYLNELGSEETTAPNLRSFEEELYATITVPDRFSTTAAGPTGWVHQGPNKPFDLVGFKESNPNSAVAFYDAGSANDAGVLGGKMARWLQENQLEQGVTEISIIDSKPGDFGANGFADGAATDFQLAFNKASGTSGWTATRAQLPSGEWVIELRLSGGSPITIRVPYGDLWPPL